ncbi:STAS domain-containing protein [Candidatus Woesearchaeota archaeon]|nr:STAS domain-containing protein [Candidatus Woesearchaeota archaeon]
MSELAVGKQSSKPEGYERLDPVRRGTYFDVYAPRSGVDADRVLVFHAKGKITLGEGDSELEVLAREFSDRKVILDMGNVSYVDSTGLGALVLGHSILRKHAGKFRLCNLSEKLLALLNATSLLNTFELSCDVPDALGGVLAKYEQVTSMVSGTRYALVRKV